MQTNKTDSIDLVCCIVNSQEGDQCIKLAGEKGVKTGTIFLGEGTARQGILKILGLDQIKKEVVLFVASSSIAKEAMDYIAEKKKMGRRNRGISFRMPLEEVIGTFSYKKEEVFLEERETMYQAIFVIVNKGEAETVMDAAQSAGVQGGTVINAHGSGEYETRRVFNIDIEPEKDIVLIITEKEKCKELTTKINEKLHLDDPNTGILFVTNISETKGLV